MNSIWRSCVQFYKRTDRLLLLLCLVCSMVSAYMLWGIYLSGYIKLRVLAIQLLATFIGFSGACLLSIFDYRSLANLWKIYMPVSLGMVALTYVAGKQRYSYIDDKAWLEIPFTGMTLQPSEILKLAFIFSFALHLEKARDSVNNPRTLLTLCLHGAVPTLMVVGQGDHGTAMVFVFIFAFMLFSAGLQLKYIAASALCVAIASPFAWFFVLDNDKRGRIMTVFNPASDPTGTGWQQSLGLTAIGSGQIWGKGVLFGEHQYVPEMHNDFIFSFIGEAGGFVGCSAVILLLALLCLLILRNARHAKDPLGRFICVGVFGMIAFQSIWVIGMCLSLLPVAGITLPLFSAGGTSVVLTWAGIGMVLGVHRHSHVGLFDER
ncbi:MAG: Bacterial cell division rane protein [Oscillospiraceae bacterium]|nr:Bacterial cell division rane protein [Oscillospiraceae bacterium]